MTQRSIRRAAERRANKLARKAGQQSAAVNPYAANPAKDNPNSEAITETQIQTLSPFIPPAAEANRSLGAVTSLVTGQATLLAASDAAIYDQLLRDYQNEFQPVGLQESNLVEFLANADWRIRRLFALEMGIFAQGRIEFAEQFAAHNPEIRASLLEVHTFLTYEKQIRGLQLQEARLSRRAAKDRAELHQLQKERKEREKAASPSPAVRAARANQPPAEPQPDKNGFVFTNHEITSPGPREDLSSY